MSVVDIEPGQVRDESIDQFATLVNSGNLRFGEPSSADMERINARIPTELRPDQLFVMPAVISNDSRDSHMTRMRENTLRNYAADADTGVPVMNSHRTPSMSLFGSSNGELPIGRSFFGEYDEAQKQARSHGYVLRDHFPNGQGNLGTNDLIRAVEGGVITDVSVGFYLGTEGRYFCGVCNADTTNFWTDACDHITGEEYDTPEGRIMAFEWVDNAHLREWSPVYKGSTGGAGFTKSRAARVERLFERGIASRAQAHRFEERSGIRIIARHQGVDVPTVPTTPPPAATRQEPQPITLDEFVREAGLSGTSYTDWSVLARSVRNALEQTSRRITDLEPRAKLGNDYLTELREQVIAAGIRAMGNDFPAEAQTQMLALVTDPAALRSLRDSHEALAKRQFGAAGTETYRQSKPMGAVGTEVGNRWEPSNEPSATADAYKTR